MNEQQFTEIFARERKTQISSLEEEMGRSLDNPIMGNLRDRRQG